MIIGMFIILEVWPIFFSYCFASGDKLFSRSRDYVSYGFKPRCLVFMSSTNGELLFGYDSKTLLDPFNEWFEVDNEACIFDSLTLVWVLLKTVMVLDPDYYCLDRVELIIEGMFCLFIFVTAFSISYILRIGADPNVLFKDPEVLRFSL